MATRVAKLGTNELGRLIYEIRAQRVMLDSDLASIYRVETKALNRAVKRNRDRFPKDFVFQLTADESEVLRRQSGTLKTERGAHRKYLPWAFTEHGAIMAANVLNSPRAVQMSVFVIRAFVKMRSTLLSTRDLAKKLAALEKQLTGRLDTHEAAIVHVLQELMDILNPPPEPATPSRPKIGFQP